MPLKLERSISLTLPTFPGWKACPWLDHPPAQNLQKRGKCHCEDSVLAKKNTLTAWAQTWTVNNKECSTLAFRLDAF